MDGSEPQAARGTFSGSLAPAGGLPVVATAEVAGFGMYNYLEYIVFIDFYGVLMN